ncbi:MAG: hypothetical protein DRZ82_00970 [Thermoprotei archaeon]|nr:MAG: hypothetical protein DRZ82_00970 [Thermoprotei archaeon]
MKKRLENLSLDEAAKMHGHKGPWLVLGYKAGLRACELLEPDDEMSLYCIAYIPLKTPYTCTLDGIQASAHCTLGKMNIEVRNAKDHNNILFIFINRKTGKKLELRLKPGVAKWIEKMKRVSMREAAKRVEEERLCNLFEEKLYD